MEPSSLPKPRTYVALQARLENLPVRVVRFDGGFLASLRRPAATPRNGWLDPVDWVHVRWGRPGKHEVQVGRDWQTPAPDVPGKAFVIGEG